MTTTEPMTAPALTGWRVDRYGLGPNGPARYCQVLDADGNLVADLGDCAGTRAEIARVADMIAAAPDLLAVLIAVCGRDADDGEHWMSEDMPAEIWDKVRAAIARAEGGAA